MMALRFRSMAPRLIVIDAFSRARHRVPPPPRTRPTTTVPPAVSFVEASHVVGDAIGAFMLVYTTLQWAHYRRLRKSIEDKEK